MKTMQRGDYHFKPCSLQVIRRFVEKWHYTRSVNGLRISQCFVIFKYRHKGLMSPIRVIGAAIYGKLGMANVWQNYGDAEDEVAELKRLCCVDSAPQNTESWFIGKTLKWLEQNTSIQTVISYADMLYNHNGTIYQATNFDYRGTTGKQRIIKVGDRIYHDHAIRAINDDGSLKPFALRLRSMLATGKAKYVETPGKHIYVYYLDKKKRRKKV